MEKAARDLAAGGRKGLTTDDAVDLFPLSFFRHGRSHGIVVLCSFLRYVFTLKQKPCSFGLLLVSDNCPIKRAIAVRKGTVRGKEHYPEYLACLHEHPRPLSPLWHGRTPLEAVFLFSRAPLVAAPSNASICCRRASSMEEGRVSGVHDFWAQHVGHKKG